MKLFCRKLLGDRRGIGAVEFALMAPVFFLMLFGIMQMGVLFLAHAGLRNAVSEGARYATLFPRPTQAQIVAFVNANRAPLDTGRYSAPVVTFGTDGGAQFAQITMTYTQPLQFLIYTTPPVTLRYTRRVFIPPAAAAPAPAAT